MKKILVLALLTSIVLLNVMCQKAVVFDEQYYDARLSGGASTVFLANSKALGEPVPGLSPYDAFVHDEGDALFDQTFVSSPAQFFPGLGPVFNNVSCISCHHNDGKGTPTLGDVNSSLLTRISIPGMDEHGGPLSAPGFGAQLQDKSVAGAVPEVRVNVSYEEIPFVFSDGEKISLRKPTYTLSNPYIPLPANYMISVRIAPPVSGLGLLDLIPESTILSKADPNDKDGDGIRGRPNYVYNPYTKKTELGRYGLKANVSTIQIQVASALQQDMGVTNYIFPEESSLGQSQYNPTYGIKDLSDYETDALVFYVQTLAVPARRDVNDSSALRGERIFKQLNCTGCHTPTVQTGVNTQLPMMSNQRIHPYTDMLLHDMGDGLSDGRPDFKAGANDWRTPPLWGIGLYPKTNGTGYYLHDGRARSILEAILWHGGEAEKSKAAFVKLSKIERKDLLKFLNSL